MTKDKWVWMPHPAHFCAASSCKFKLATYVGGYIVSTVGEYLPDSDARDLLAVFSGVTLNGIGDERRHDYIQKIGWEEVGLDRKYETMVFKAKKSKDTPCCLWKVSDHTELDMQGYNEPEDAYQGHLALCEKWSKKSELPPDDCF